MKSYDLIIKNAQIHTMDEDRKVYAKGIIGIEGEKITLIKEMNELTPEELAQHKTKRPAARRHICLVSWDELDGLPQSSPGILKRYDYENAAAVFQS